MSSSASKIRRNLNVCEAVRAGTPKIRKFVHCIELSKTSSTVGRGAVSAISHASNIVFRE